MAAIVKLPSGSWRAQVRRKGKYVTATFLRRKDADEWALATERNIDRGVMPNSPDPKSVRTLASIIDLHIRDHKEVGKPIRRSKTNVLEALRISLGNTRINDLKRSKLIEYGKRRAKEGAGPATLAIDFSFLGTLLTHAAAVHGIEVFPEEVKLARVALSRLGLVGKGTERDRRPTQDELTRLIVYFNHKPRQLIPMARIIRFAVATAMRIRTAPGMEARRAETKINIGTAEIVLGSVHDSPSALQRGGVKVKPDFPENLAVRGGLRCRSQRQRPGLAQMSSAHSMLIDIQGGEPLFFLRQGTLEPAEARPDCDAGRGTSGHAR